MSNALEFKLPDVGEGLVEAEIVSWKVEPGDTVKVNDVIVEIETAKSLVELPSPYAGTIGGLLVPEGQVVPVGTPIVSILPAGAKPDAAGAGAGAGAGAEEEPAKTLVGYGPRASSTQRRARRSAGTPRAEAAPPPEPAQPPERAPAPEPTAAPSAAAAPSPNGSTGSNGRTAETQQNKAVPALAKPPVRKLAKDLGIDLHAVPGSGPDGSVTRADLEAYRSRPAERTTAAPVAGERETRVPVRGVRRATAEAVTSSAFTAPHVTVWKTLDVTATVDLVERLRTHRDLADVRVSPLLVIAKACLLAIRRTPEINATWHDTADGAEIVLRNYVNLGIAAATPRGLVVPHVADADRLGLPDLARALAELTATAREGRTPPGDMIGTTFTITNVGVFGVDGGTPILNPGETGILAVGAFAERPWVVDGQVVPRRVATLSLSVDHRIVDGEQASRFLTDVAGLLEDPSLALMF